MYRSSPFRSTLSTGYITALDMCEVCTQAVHSVAPWARVTSQLWTSVKYEPPSDTFVHISTTFTRFCVSRTILRLHFRGAWFGNSTTLPRLYLWHPANSTTLTRAPNQPGAKNNNRMLTIENELFCTYPTKHPNTLYDRINYHIENLVCSKPRPSRFWTFLDVWSRQGPILYSNWRKTFAGCSSATWPVQAAVFSTRLARVAQVFWD